MKCLTARFVLGGVLVVFAATVAAAQGVVTTSLSGTAVDSAGGVIPGASVTVMSKATGSLFTAITSVNGTFTVPALDAGLYTVAVSLAGFKTAVLDDIRLPPGVPVSVRATLEVGSVEETIVVEAGSDLVNSQTATVSANLNVDQINRMPLATRNALNAVTFLPGVNTSGVIRDTTNVNGLPQSFINITLDGVSNNDNFQKTSDGFFAYITPRQDSVEAVTVTMAAGGADIGGHGAVGINFVTRSGTNKFSGSVYEYHRAPELNSNYWFNKRNNLPKNDVTLDQYGIRQGGPIVLPGFDGREKAFFFLNYEELRLPNNFSRTRTVLHPRAQQGWFRYTATVNSVQEVREVNVLALAAANGQLATPDPLVGKVLGYINSSMQTTGVVNATSDPLVNDYVWQSPGNQTEKQPVIRIDYNLSENHRVSGTYNQEWRVRDPDHLNTGDRRFPASPNYSKVVQTKPARTVTLRSTLGQNMVSELRGGITRGDAQYFGQESSNGIATFADTNGFAIGLDSDGVLGGGLTNWHRQNTPNLRSAYAYSFDENLSWLKDKHSILVGGSLYFGRSWQTARQEVPAINLGFNTTQDPAAGLFTAANFAGASAGQLTDARALYALLTGRVLSVTGQAALDPITNKYVAFGDHLRAGKMDQYSAFVQDSWHAASTLTINAGLRWDVQMPFAAVNDVMSAASLADVCGVSGVGSGGTYNACNFFRPGATGGKRPEFEQLTTGTLGYHTDWNNLAPSVGVAWRPNAHDGWLRGLLGDPDQATLRGGYSIAYERQGMGEFMGVFGPNPGSTLSLTRSLTTGIIGPGESWPVLLREPNRLYNASFPDTAAFPIAIRPNRADSINAFHPDIKIASARTWTAGFQRSLSKSTALEARYVGTRGVDQWSTLDYNERNIIENGFFNEFKLGMANLQANNASGVAARSGSFAYFGPGTGTSPLPTYLAYLVGSKDAANPAAYTGGSNTWTNSTLTQRFVRTNPAPNNSASDLDGSLARRQNAALAGLPANFFVVNPDASSVNVTDSGAYSTYHALQVELRRRLSDGLQVNGSYQYALEAGSSFQGFHDGRVLNPTSGSVRHAIKAQWDWTLPVGHGERFAASAGSVLNGLIGGWQFNGAGRIQARTINLGNVRLIGMTLDDVQKMYRFDIRNDPATGLQTVLMMPDDVILNTRRAYSVSTTSPTGYSDLGVPEGRYFAPANSADCIQVRTGDCAPRTQMLIAPFFTRVDVGVTKRFPIRGRTNFELRLDVLNVFDNINFNPTANPGTGATIFQTGSAYTDLSNTFDPGGRLGMLVGRFNW